MDGRNDGDEGKRGTSEQGAVDGRAGGLSADAGASRGGPWGAKRTASEVGVARNTVRQPARRRAGAASGARAQRRAAEGGTRALRGRGRATRSSCNSSSRSVASKRAYARCSARSSRSVASSASLGSRRFASRRAGDACVDRTLPGGEGSTTSTSSASQPARGRLEAEAPHRRRARFPVLRESEPRTSSSNPWRVACARGSLLFTTNRGSHPRAPKTPLAHPDDPRREVSIRRTA